MPTIRTNLKTNAPTQYTNFAFTSMIDFNGMLLGAGEAGLMKLCCGTDDNGTAISAYFVTPDSDFGIPGNKKARFAYFDMECSGSMKITLTSNNETMGPYTVTPDSLANERVRVSIGRKNKWKYAAVQVENVDGSVFAIDAMDLLLIQTIRKR